MFLWNEFTSSALTAVGARWREDGNLAEMLGSRCPAKEQTDAFGRPLPESVLIRQMNDLDNFKRALRIRRNLAQDTGNTNYVSYADAVLDFLEPIMADAELVTVLIATRTATYEFFFAPELKKTLVERVMA